MDYHIFFSPTKKQEQLNEIEKWLIEERRVTGEGFHCNWSIVERCYKNKTFAIIEENESTIGFACWRNTSRFSAEITILEINPNSRKKGIGRYFVESLLQFFRQQNIYIPLS